MKKAYVFPGQGAQFIGMGKDVYDCNNECKKMFEQANEILGFNITDIMFSGTEDDLKQTKVTQPAVFLHSVALAHALGENFKPDMVAGHSLGEFSALVAAKAMRFEDGLKLVSIRANAMQKACESNPGTMAAIIALPNEVIEEVCASITDTVIVPANYNCPGQLVISGTIEGVDQACKILTEKGAKRALKLKVGGAFHSPLMEPARIELAKGIEQTEIKTPICPIYQNVNAKAVTNSDEIKQNLIKQLTSPVKWTHIIENMITDGANSFTEVGPGKALQGMIVKINKDVEVLGATI